MTVGKLKMILEAVPDDQPILVPTYEAAVPVARWYKVWDEFKSRERKKWQHDDAVNNTLLTIRRRGRDVDVSLEPAEHAGTAYVALDKLTRGE